MGKQGPCYHCGVTSTPLWRNGPPDKPVLCNACGSRWRTKGTLANYTPLHLRAEPENFENHEISRVKIVSGNKNKELKLLKRKKNTDNVVISGTSEYHQGFRKVVDEDISNRSSSGSAISNSESCVQFGGAEASDMSGPAQSVVWDTLVPSKKRTCFSHSRPSSIEKLTKDLHTILHEQRQSSYFSGSSEEDLLYESEIPMVSVEIGHGSVLIKHPHSISREEESEASSLSFDHKANLGNEAYSHPAALSVHNGNKGVKCQISGMGKDDRFTRQRIQQDQVRRENVQLGQLELVGNHSPLCAIDIKDIFNFDVFVRNLTSEEQQHMFNYLPPVDFAGLPHSLRGMFDSPQFTENLISFQQLLSEGVFDDSLLGVKDEDCNTLKGLALSNLTKSKLVENYNSLKNCKNGGALFAASGVPCTIASGILETIKRSCDGENLCFSETKCTMKSPKRTILSKISSDAGEFVDIDGSYYTPTSVFALPHSSSSLMLESFNFADETHDQDLLLDVPSNNSFPQAELLPTSSFSVAEASASIHVSSVPDNARWRFH